MRKIATIVLVAILILAAVGCSNSKEENTSNTSTETSTPQPSTSENTVESNQEVDYSHVETYVGKDSEFVALKYLECVNKYDAETFIALIGGANGSDLDLWNSLATSFDMSLAQYGELAFRSNREEFEDNVGNDWFSRISVEDINYSSDDTQAYVYIEFEGSDHVVEVVLKRENEAWILH